MNLDSNWPPPGIDWYYHDEATAIACADCREILPLLPSVDLVLTDPQHGIDGGRGGLNTERKKGVYGSCDTMEYVRTVCVPAFLAALALCQRAILTPGNKCLTFYPPPDSFGCFYYPASAGLQSWGRGDSSPIFYYGKFPGESRWIPATSCSYTVTEQSVKNGHPCPKPIGVWSKLLRVGTWEDDVVLDPFMGSGTTLRAAKDLGRRAVGIEIDESYCEIAAKRLQQECFQFSTEPNQAKASVLETTSLL